jgi:hypothetical protein
MEGGGGIGGGGWGGLGGWGWGWDTHYTIIEANMADLTFFKNIEAKADGIGIPASQSGTGAFRYRTGTPYSGTDWFRR